MVDFGLPPDGQRGQSIDRTMRQSLADSLTYIGTEISGVIDFDAGLLQSLTSGMQQGLRYPPSTFGLYCELVLALENGDNQQATTLLRELLQEIPQRQQQQKEQQRQQWEIAALEDPASSAQSARYLRLMDTDTHSSFAMLPPSAAAAADFAARFTSAYRLLCAAIPALAAEFDALVSRVIVVAADPAARYQFDGGSSYMLWGGLFLNAASHTSEVALIEVIAHESAHLLLFGFASDEPLVNNSDDILYRSPLRTDARPMDGIFHATWVSARMHWAMSQLLASALLDAAAREYAEQARQADRENFWAGYAVVKQHSDLTATGAAVMAAAKTWMETTGTP